MLRIALVCHFLIYAVFAHSALPSRENVVVTSQEEYRFVDTPAGLIVKTVEKTTYEATRHSETVTPHVYYNNVVSLDKVSGGKAQYRNANPPNVFHDDSKVCFFDVYLKGKGSKAKAEFRRTFNDAAYFTKIFIADSYPIRDKTIRFEIPGSRPDIKLTEMNFPEKGVVRTDDVAPDGSRVVTFVLSGLPETRDEEGSPSAMAGQPYVLVDGYFSDLSSLYEYHRPMLEVDTVIPGVDAVLSEALEGATGTLDKIGGIYRFVQRAVRYVAFEEGEAGYRPDAPSEVLRKRYGDCKGMALLLATLLNRSGIEARVALVGTRNIPFNIAEHPSLAATNHMICIVPEESGMLFLDATNEYISIHDIPHGIQGKDAMVCMPDGYEMVEIPCREAGCSADKAEYSYRLCDGMLAGHVERRLCGDMLEWFMTKLETVSKPYRTEAISRSLVPGVRAGVDSDSIGFDLAKAGELRLSARIDNTQALTESDGIVYVDLNTAGEPFSDRVDTDERQNDYELPFPALIVRRSVIDLPAGAVVGALPDDYFDDCGVAELSCRFERSKDGAVVMTKSMLVKQTRIPLGDLKKWNKSLAGWNEAANHQVEIKIK